MQTKWKPFSQHYAVFSREVATATASITIPYLYGMGWGGPSAPTTTAVHTRKKENMNEKLKHHTSTSRCRYEHLIHISCLMCLMYGGMVPLIIISRISEKKRTDIPRTRL